MKFIICPVCQGKGQLQEKKCSQCHNREVYGWFGGYLLFLDKIFSAGEIMGYYLKIFFKILLRILFILLGIWGFLCLLKIILIIFNLSNLEWLDNLLNFFPFLNYPLSDLRLIFWVSVLGDCFIFYTIEKERDEKIKIRPRVSRVSKEVIEQWDQAHKLARKYKIDVGDSFSSKTVKIIQGARKLAEKFSQAQIKPIHLFASCLKDNDVALVINRLGIDHAALKERLARVFSRIPRTTKNKSITYSLEAQKVLLRAYEIAGKDNHISLSPLEVLQALTEFEGAVKEIFYDLEIKAADIRNVCLWIKIYEELRQKQQYFSGQAKFKPKGPINRAYTAIATPYLDTYSEDLTQTARSGYLDICLDREKERDDIYHILEGGQGVILVGEPGTGKTTIINGLARKMVTEDVPLVFKDKRLVSLNLPSLIAGASQSGEVEKRLQIILSEISRSGNIILFIRNIHNMIGVRTTAGELDISEILASVLRQRNFLVLATSTPREYRRLIEGQALAEVFSQVKILEPDKNVTIQILESKAALIESKEQVYFSYGALNQAVELSQRYLTDQFLPAKAIKLIQEVAIRVRNTKGKKSIIQAKDVAQLVAEKTNIPVTKITEKESEKLMNLEEQIHQRLIDQNEAVKMVSAALRRARTELRSEQRPIVNLLFLGPTGVGKTELAKTVTEVYFGDEKRMIRLDMSEYQEKTSINRLIGFSGDNQGGQLTEAVRSNPSSVLLLDEIEKAHPDILNVFLQVMDDGRLTDATGRTVDFTNLIIISTSNAGTGFIQEEIKKKTSVEKITEVLVQEKLKPYFRPEFLNRFDGVIVFKPLSKEDLKKITKLLLKKLTRQIEEKGINFKATEEAIEEIVIAGYDPAFGARPLRRVLQNQVSDSLAKLLLTKKITRRDTVILDKGGELKIIKAEKF